MANYDSNYAIAQEISARIGNSPVPFDSVYSICLAIYQELGGTEEDFDSVYSILLEILPLATETAHVIDDSVISSGKTWSSSKINSELGGKQNTLTAGEGIEISGNTISVTGADAIEDVQSLPDASENKDKVLRLDDNKEVYISKCNPNNAPESGCIGNATCVEDANKEEGVYDGEQITFSYYTINQGTITVTGYKWIDLDDNSLCFATEKPASEIYYYEDENHNIHANTGIYLVSLDDLTSDEHTSFSSLYIPQLNVPDAQQIDNAYINTNVLDNEHCIYKGVETTIQYSGQTITGYTWVDEDKNLTCYSTKRAFEIYNTNKDSVDVQFYNNDGGIFETTFADGNLLSISTVKYPRNEYQWKEVATSDELDSKQDELVAGQNITISGTTISADGYVFDETKGSLATKYLNEDDEQNPYVTNNIASGNSSIAEGYGTKATGVAAHAEGVSWQNPNYTGASGDASHTEGDSCEASGYASHAEGGLTKATGSQCAHAEGLQTVASGKNSHAEGNKSVASGNHSHAEGAALKNQNPTTASGNQSHAEGGSTLASAQSSHAEGELTVASGAGSHAEGNMTVASGIASHAEGDKIDVLSPTTAAGRSSHAEGTSTLAQNESEHAEGRVNVSHKASDTYGNAGNTQHSVGIFQKNALEVMQNGDYYLYGVGGYQGTNTKVQDNTIKPLQTVISDINTSVAGKQDTLTAGTNITISGTTISATYEVATTADIEALFS